MRALLPLLLMTLLTMTGCATRDAQLGASVQNSVVAQVVDLEPVYAGVPIEGGSGTRSVEAVNRYNRGEVKVLYRDGIGKKPE